MSHRAAEDDDLQHALSCVLADPWIWPLMKNGKVTCQKKGTHRKNGNQQKRISPPLVFEVSVADSEALLASIAKPPKQRDTRRPAEPVEPPRKTSNSAQGSLTIGLTSKAPAPPPPAPNAVKTVNLPFTQVRGSLAKTFVPWHAPQPLPPPKAPQLLPEVVPNQVSCLTVFEAH